MTKRHTHIHIHTMKYYSAMKMNENLPFAATWMDLEGTMLGEMSDQDKHYMISLICGI